VKKNLAAEGDVNLSRRRQAWQERTLSDAARALLAEDARFFLHQSLSTPCLDTLKSASGIWLETLDGRRIMDFHGNSVHQLGHGHPRVVEAVKRALDELPFSPRRYTNEYAVALARKLSVLTGLEKVLFAPGGAEAIGMALKLARLATGRHKTISMWDSFHGASLDAISLGGEALFRSGIGPLLPGTEHVQPCDARHCNFGCGGSCNLRCADYVEYVLAKEEDVAAVVVETVRSTDVQVPPPDYYRKLRAACDRHGALRSRRDSGVPGAYRQHVCVRALRHRPRHGGARQRARRRRVPDGRAHRARRPRHRRGARARPLHPREEPGRLRRGARSPGSH
jgi:4-aminobutyrate aminotransferase